jgi:hypothetical protein
MDPRELETRLEEAEQRLKALEENEKRRHNQVLRLTAVVMALSEKLQEKKILRGEQFEQRVQAHLKSLDREISDRRTQHLLDELLGLAEDENSRD